VWALAFEPKGGRLASCGDDREVLLWAPGERRGPTRLGKHYHELRGLAFSPDGKSLAAAELGQVVYLWELATPPKKHGPLPGHPQGAASRTWAASLAFSADGKRLAAAGEDYQVRLWELAPHHPAGPAQTVQVFPPHHGRVTSVAFLPAGGLAFGGTDGSVLLKPGAAGEEVRGHGHTGEVTALVVSPRGQTVVSSGAEGTIRLWQARTGAQVGRFEAHPGGVTALALSRDGKTLASGGQDGKVCLWKVTLD
jgi:WD40 repeat protein